MGSDMGALHRGFGRFCARGRSPALLQVVLQPSHRRPNPYVDIKLIA